MLTRDQYLAGRAADRNFYKPSAQDEAIGSLVHWGGGAIGAVALTTLIAAAQHTNVSKMSLAIPWAATGASLALMYKPGRMAERKSWLNALDKDLMSKGYEPLSQDEREIYSDEYSRFYNSTRENFW